MDVAPGNVVEVATVATLATAAAGVAAVGAFQNLQEDGVGTTRRVAVSSSGKGTPVSAATEALRRKTIIEKRKKELNDAVPWLWPILAVLSTCGVKNEWSTVDTSCNGPCSIIQSTFFFVVVS